MDTDLIIGIDLGTTNSLVGVVESGFPIVLADNSGSRITPSAVHLGKDQSILVGSAAQRMRPIEPERTMTSIKRLIGRTFDQLSSEEIESSHYPLQPDAAGNIAIKVSETEITSPIQLSAEILDRLKTIAEEALEHEVSRAVITVPAYFSNTQREATKEAAELAGLTVERIINEPTAAALAYGLDKLDDEQTVAVYDLGGGTFDLSILQMKDGLFEVIATGGDTQLGGDDIDELIAEWVINELELSDLNTGETAILRTKAREAKETLGKEDAYTIRLPFFRGETSYELTITREVFENLITPVLNRTRKISEQVLAEAAYKNCSEIDHLILVGGSTRIPFLREKLQEWFSLEPNLTQHPDEAIALGAAIQAGILCGQIRSIVLVDVTPLTLGIETFGGLMNAIIPRNSTIPAKAGELFTNAVANQESIAIRILQGEREMAKDNWLLGEIIVPFTPGAKGSARVGVQFAIDENGILEVIARNTETGEDQVLEIRNAAVDVEDSKVEAMVNASIDHAFDDMNERVWTEAKLKSEELLPAVDTALAQVGSLLASEEITLIRERVAAVQAILEAPGQDVAGLKRANQALDEATQTLAARLVEAAFDDI